MKQSLTPALPSTIDPLIRPLVEALTRFSLTTVGSCQGHLPGPETSPGSHRLPLVLFLPSPHLGLVHVLAHLIGPQGWSPQETGIPRLKARWTVTVCSSTPSLNPDNFAYFALEPAASSQPGLVQDPTYPSRLKAAQHDLLSIAHALTWYRRTYGLPRDPTVLSAPRFVSKAERALALLRSFVNSHRTIMENDHDYPGSNAVEFLCDFYRDSNNLLRRKR